MKRKALGKGLRSLIPEGSSSRPASPAAAAPATAAPPPGPGFRLLDIDQIRPNPWQPRRAMDDQALDELAASLKEQGVLQPVLVRPAGEDAYELVAGERRWRAAQRAGLLKLPAIVRDTPDAKLLEMALVENIQRADLNPIDEAEAYRALIEDLGLTQAEVADRVGKQRATVTNALRLLGLAPEVQELVRAGEISMGHARALAAISEAALQIEVAERIRAGGLSVRSTETLVARMARPRAPRGEAPVRDPNEAAAEEALQTRLGTKVRITRKDGGAGVIEISFYGPEELMRLYDLLAQSARA